MQQPPVILKVAGEIREGGAAIPVALVEEHVAIDWRHQPEEQEHQGQTCRDPRGTESGPRDGL